MNASLAARSLEPCACLRTNENDRFGSASQIFRARSCPAACDAVAALRKSSSAPDLSAFSGSSYSFSRGAVAGAARHTTANCVLDFNSPPGLASGRQRQRWRSAWRDSLGEDQTGFRRRQCKSCGPPASRRCLRNCLDSQENWTAEAPKARYGSTSAKRWIPRDVGVLPDGGRSSKGGPLGEVGSIGTAFSTMLYSLRVVYAHALGIRQYLFAEKEMADLMVAVQREMSTSFIWLFQQVFAATPSLMVAIIVLMAEFTAHSTTLSVQALANPPALSSVRPAPAAPAPKAVASETTLGQERGSSTRSFAHPRERPANAALSETFPSSSSNIVKSPLLATSSPLMMTSSVGMDNSVSFVDAPKNRAPPTAVPRLLHAAPPEGAAESSKSLVVDTTFPVFPHPQPFQFDFESSPPSSLSSQGFPAAYDDLSPAVEVDRGMNPGGGSMPPQLPLTKAGSRVAPATGSLPPPLSPNADSSTFLKWLRESRKLDSADTSRQVAQGDEPGGHESTAGYIPFQMNLAPVTAKLEVDNYACFDRTELIYEEMAAEEECPSVVLANYAQFLYIVRHDYDRAEHFFHRALALDDTDGILLTRFATFLWLARSDRVGADQAFRGAIATHPLNPYFTGSYAHFLWHVDTHVACP